MATKRPLIEISAPFAGQLSNEFEQSSVGGQLLQQCDITTDGILKAAEAIAADFTLSTSVIATDFEYFDDGSGNNLELYAIAGVRIYRKRNGSWSSIRTNGQTVTANSFQSLKAFDFAAAATTKRILYYTSDGKLGGYYYDGASEQFNDSLSTFANADTKAHPMETKGGYLYIGDGNKIARLEPLGAAFDDDALVMTKEYRALCIKTYNDRLCIGTYRGTAITDVAECRLITWQGIAGVEEEESLSLGERGITAMEVYQSYLWIFAGVKGHIYKFNGATISPAEFEIPNVSRQVYVKPNAVAVIDNKLLFGLSDDNADANETALQGIYQIFKKKPGYPFSLSFPYIESDNGTLLIQVGAIEGNVAGTAFHFSRYNNTNYKIDISSTNRATLATAPEFHTQKYLVAIGDAGTVINSFEILAKLLPSGTSVRIDYKQDNAAAWTTNSYTFTSTNQNSKQAVGLKNCKILQLKVVLITSSGSTPEIYKILVW